MLHHASHGASPIAMSAAGQGPRPSPGGLVSHTSSAAAKLRLAPRDQLGYGEDHFHNVRTLRAQSIAALPCDLLEFGMRVLRRRPIGCDGEQFRPVAMNR